MEKRFGSNKEGHNMVSVAELVLHIVATHGIR